MDMAVLAGTVSAVLFATANLPMVVKAARTRDLASYSLGNLLLVNAGNVLYTLYVVTLPVGPIWALHAFYLVTMAVMLALFLRFARRDATASGPVTGLGPALDAGGTLKHGRRDALDRGGSARL